MNTSVRCLVVLSTLLSLVACAQATYDWSADTLPPPNLVDVTGRESPGSAAPVRVIVQFHTPIAGDDAPTMQALQAQAQSQMRYLSSVSTDTHVYSLQLPPSQDPARALQRLAAHPAVKRVERDLAVKAH